MRFFFRSSPTPVHACIVALLLLTPTFLVLGSEGSSSAASALPSASAQVPPSSQPSAFSSYKSVGTADPSLSVLVSVAIPLRNLPLLASVVKESSDPTSPDYRHFLTYSQVSQTFLPTQEQYQSVADYLTSSGFTIQSSYLNSMIVARGTAAEVTQYLGQSVQIFTNGTYSYYETTGASSLQGAYSFASNSTGLLMRPDYTVSKDAVPGPVPSANVTFTEGGQDTKLLRTVYNSTGLISKGDDGKNFTIGIVDFYGNPLVTQDLALYDQTYGYPAPPSFTVSPIGPYNPNLGLPTGWDGEIDLDVQVSHAMAPDANIILYAGNGELSLATAIAAVVQDDKANVVSQSFGIPEWEYYEAGPTPYLFNLVFPDDYYELGSAMGMTFLASSGDGGGSGYSAGPEGGVEYPSSSPFVTALGGTDTYISTSASGALTFNQTAWSNIGFVPYLVNEGGSGGGVSIVEPTPWYQSSLTVPPSFPDGRMVPDLSLDSSGSPGTFIIYQGAPVAFGGTSEASPLFAGLATLLMGAEGGPLGLINPTLYQLAQNSKTYQKAFYPITFGYTIPWVSQSGYNLATGWGAPNIGEIASLYRSAASPSSLAISVGLVNPGKDNFTDFTPGEVIHVVANITAPSGTPVTSGTFTVSLQTLAGSTVPVPVSYTPAQKTWTASITVTDQAGVAYVNVAGSEDGRSGQGLATTFVGYLANFIQPISPYPWTYLPGLVTAIAISDLFGKNPSFLTTQIAFQNYSILTNSYTPIGTANLNYSTSDGYYQGTVTASLPSGPMTLVTEGGVIGYLPCVSGIGLLGTDIYPQMVAEPGSVAPGQSLTIVASITAPENIYLTTSLSTGLILGSTIAEGSNVTATLVNPSGASVATVSLTEGTCTQALKVCGAAVTNINGYMTIPTNATPGLYTVMLNARYDDETTGFNYTGSYYGQVYVAAAAAVPQVTVGPSTLFEGENATITANITSSDGKEITQGVYTAFVYPAAAQDDFSVLMHMTYSAFNLIPLSYDAKLGLWTAYNVTMPSPTDSSIASTTNANAEYYGGPYDVYVSGISAGGTPTTCALSAQQAFYVQPYVYTANTFLTSPQQTSRLALSNVTISSGGPPLTLSNDYFIGNNTVTGLQVTISSSSINGTLYLSGGATVLDGVDGGSVVASNTNIVLQHTSLSSLRVEPGATASIDSASSYGTISPAIPTLSISSPAANESYTGSINATVNISGSGVTALTFILDGRRLPSTLNGPPGQQVSIPIDTASLPDGTHTLTVTAIQYDLLTTSKNVSFITDNQLVAVTSRLASANKTITSLNGTVNTLSGELQNANSNIASLQKNLTNLTNIAYAIAAAAVVAIALGVYAIRGGRGPWKY